MANYEPAGPRFALGVNAASLLLPVLCIAGNALHAQEAAKGKWKQGPSRAEQVAFEQNAGQVMDQDHHPRNDVLFHANTKGLDLYIRDNGISYQLTKAFPRQEEPEAPMAGKGMRGEARRSRGDSLCIYRIDVNWLGSCDDPLVKKGAVLPGYTNYYEVPLGQDPVLRVHQYGSVTLRDIWKGVDLDLNSRNGVLESDWTMEDPANFTNIRFEVLGADLGIAPDGALVMDTPYGEIREACIKADQRGSLVDAHWVIKGNVVSVNVGHYEAGVPLHIDPPIRIWGTYVGGTGEEEGFGVSMDGSGGVYMAGSSFSGNMATTGAYQTVGGTEGSAYLAHFNADGERLWATYYGGYDEDFGYSCATGRNGDVFMSGCTKSNTLIATPGAYQEVRGSIVALDAFLVRFNSDGMRIWGTYFGGQWMDEGWSCATDSADNVFLAGNTYSLQAIASPGAHQSIQGDTSDGTQDAFLAKFDSSGTRLWSTYLGGYGDDEGFSCATDPEGNVYLAGSTFAGENISTTGAFQEERDGYSDAYLEKFDPSGVRLWGTYFGGEGLEGEGHCTTDALGQIFLVGWTLSDSAIATPGCHQLMRSGDEDNFIAKFDTAGQRQWSTYYGGWNDDQAFGCHADGAGSVLVAGWTKSNGMATPGAYDEGLSGVRDAFLARFNSDGVLHWATYYGGSGEEYGRDCTGEADGVAYLCGYTNSTYGVASSGAYTTSYVGGLWDIFLVKMDGCAPFNVSLAATATSICENDSVELTAGGALSYAWSASPGLFAGTGNTAMAYPPSSTSYSVTGSNQWECEAHASVEITVLAIDTAVTLDGPDLIALQNDAQYQWLDCDNGMAPVPGAMNQSFTPLQNGSFAAEITRGGCMDTTSCFTLLSVGIDPVKAEAFHVYPNPARGQATYSFDATGAYQLQVLDARGAVVLSERIQGLRQGTLDLSGLSSGIYTVELKGDQVLRERLCVGPQ